MDICLNPSDGYQEMALEQLRQDKALEASNIAASTSSGNAIGNMIATLGSAAITGGVVRIMETNVGPRGYFQTEALAKELRNRNMQAEPTGNGLLRSTRRQNPMTPELEDSPAVRVAEYFNTIRDKRMEINGGRTTV